MKVLYVASRAPHSESRALSQGWTGVDGAPMIAATKTVEVALKPSPIATLPCAAPALLPTGDLWRLAESCEGRKVPRFDVDRARTPASMDKVEALAKGTGARVASGHVLATSPAPLESTTWR